MTLKEIEEQKKKNLIDTSDDLTGESTSNQLILNPAETKPAIPGTKTPVAPKPATDSTSIAQAKLKALKDKREKDTYLKETERLMTDFIISVPANGVKVTQVEKKKE